MNILILKRIFATFIVLQLLFINSVAYTQGIDVEKCFEDISLCGGASIQSSSTPKKKVKSYLERCDVTSDQIKKTQRILKDLELYPYRIDGLVGKGTLAGIKKAKEMLGAKASVGECITSADIKAFDHLAASMRCSPNNLDQCSDAVVCDRATVVRSGVRSWNFDEISYVNRANDLSLDCKITIDNTSFSKEEAVYYLSQLIEFVSDNAGDFDLKFASEFDKVRKITQGEWSAALSNDFELFRVYIAKFPSFQKHLEELRLADDAANQKRVEQLRGKLIQDMAILKEWAKSNVLDAKAAEIASLDANVGNKSLQDVNALEQLVAESQRLLSATGIKDGPLKTATEDLVESLYDPSSVYILANTSGDAANLYKDLEGQFKFEKGSGIYCATEKLGAFDFYLIREKIFEVFENLNSLNRICSQASDVFIVKGNELTSDSVFDFMPLTGLSQVSEFSKADRDQEFEKLSYLKETIKKDVLDGTRIGFGILKKEENASKICAIIDGNNYGHREELEKYGLLMNAMNIDWNGFEKVTNNSEEAFKFLQRGQCDAIYAGSLNLGRLFLAGEVANFSLEFVPIWVSNGAVEAAQQDYEESEAASKKALAEAQQNLKDQEKLAEQAKQSKAELAIVRQRELREQNGLRFMVLKDELQVQVFSAADFGFENPSENDDYIIRYLEQDFVDQTTRYSPFDGIIDDMQSLAAERWEITEKRLDQVDYGEASFNGRLVDALQVEFKVASKNRLVGKYSEYCRSIHAIKDEEFEIWRNISVTDCSNEAATSRWKLENGFRSKWIIAQLSGNDVVFDENIEAAIGMTSTPNSKDQSKQTKNPIKDDATTQVVNAKAFDEISKSGSNFKPYTFGEPLILTNIVKLRVQSQEQIGPRPTFYDEAGNVLWLKISETSKKRFANFQIDCKENTCVAEGKLAIGMAYGEPDLVFHFENYSKNLDDVQIIESIASLLENNLPIRISVKGFPIYSDDVTRLTITNDLERFSSPRMNISLKNLGDQMLKEFVDICLNECKTLQFKGLWYPAGLSAEEYTYTK